MRDSLGSICVLSAVGVALASIAAAQDACYVCSQSCTTSGTGCATGGTVTVCDEGASDAQEGEDGFSELSSIHRQAKCYAYSGGIWLRTACSEEPLGPYEKLGSCGLQSGQCCFNAGGTVSESEAGYEVQDCEGTPCTGSGGSNNEN